MGDDRTTQIIIRMRGADKERWTNYAGLTAGYSQNRKLSSLIRKAVEEFLTKHPNPKKIEIDWRD